ncbi:hypothetical protein BA065_01070 [Nanoarchaeota archaeon NZ13-N]|uniref:Uncharacterized protein n=1 Tax=Candidatus Nanoclepta minutus TaxID=1940235 RepID=A0A397WNZ8_9ARCH|nr:MAG: hypothetical protein BA065_01070 [Nanoarchaeota archaeon NZ13-N]RIB35307.1 MAG: hypothetical protein BXU00_02135 [Candidatus Nanoclepta minutus]
MSNRIILFVDLFFFSVLLFQSCIYPEARGTGKEYLIQVLGYNLPLVMKKDISYNIPVRIYLEDTSLDWVVCLASFRSPAFEVSGSNCIRKDHESNIYEIYLPKDGYIRVVNTDYILTETSDIIINACYTYYNIFSMMGCAYRDRSCEVNITGVSPRVKYLDISRAEVIYDRKNNEFYLRIYLYPTEEENVYLMSINENISECYVRSPTDRYRVNYVLKYSNRKVEGSIDLRPGVANQVDVNLTELGIRDDLYSVYLEFRVDYIVMQKIYLGSVRIEK